MKRLTLSFAAMAVAATALVGAQQPQAPAFTPPKNDAIPVGNPGNKGDVPGAVLKSSPRHGEWVDIKLADGTKLNSWVVYPEVAGKAGVVLVIHDIYGMTAETGNWPRVVGDQLAKEGFIAIVPDLLSGKGPNGGGSPELGAGVGQAIRTLTPADLVTRLNAAMAYGKTLPAANGKTAVIGFCWGGNQSFMYAIAQPGLSAAAVYYGSAPGSGNPFAVDKAELAKLKVPVAGFYGGTDARITSSVDPTSAAAKELAKSYEYHVFDGAGHGFLRNQGTEANYNAAKDAWTRTVAFFKENLK